MPHPHPSLAAQYHPPISVKPKGLPGLPFQLDRLGWPPQTLLRQNPHRLGTVRPGHGPIKGPQNPGAEAPGAGVVAARRHRHIGGPAGEPIAGIQPHTHPGPAHLMALESLAGQHPGQLGHGPPGPKQIQIIGPLDAHGEAQVLQLQGQTHRHRQSHRGGPQGLWGPGQGGTQPDAPGR